MRKPAHSLREVLRVLRDFLPDGAHLRGQRKPAPSLCDVTDTPYSGVVEVSKVRRRAKSVSNAIRAPKSVPNTPHSAPKCVYHSSRPRRLTLPRQGYLLQPRRTTTLTPPRATGPLAPTPRGQRAGLSSREDWAQSRLRSAEKALASACVCCSYSLEFGLHASSLDLLPSP